MTEAESPTEEEEEAAIRMQDFLESVAPMSAKKISDLQLHSGAGWKLKLPFLQMYCERCEGVRTFHMQRDRPYIGWDKQTDLYAVYTCRNCYTFSKTFSIALRADEGSARLAPR